MHEQKGGDSDDDGDGFVMVLEDDKSSPHSPHSPISHSDDRFDEIINGMEEEKMGGNVSKEIVPISGPRLSGTLSRSQAAKHALKLPRIAASAQSNHYEGDNQILDFIPFHLIPQSQIIEKYGNDFEKIYLKLYDKYIDWKSSSFEVNVSGDCRNKLHNIYIRITYQLLMEEREQIMLEQEAKNEKRKSNFLTIENGWVVNARKDNKNGKDGKPRTTVMWQSRKTIVNALKATIAKQQMTDENKSEQDDEDKQKNNKDTELKDIETKVEISEVVEVLTLAEQDIIKNLNDSLSRFKRSEEFRSWLCDNMNVFGLS